METSTTDSTSSEGEIDSLIKFKTHKHGKCVICKKIGGIIIESTDKTFFTFMNSTKVRNDINNEVDEDIQKAIADGKTGNLCNVVWHKMCYIAYTSKQNIEILKKRVARLNEYRAAGIELPPLPGKSLRKGGFDINKCVFCQKRSAGKRLSQVMSKNIEAKIKNIASISSEVLERIGSNDLIAMEVKYHLNCLMIESKKLGKQFGKPQSVTKESTTESARKKIRQTEDTPLQEIIKFVELNIGKGKGFTTTAIFHRYKELGGMKSKKTIMEILKQNFGPKIKILKSEKANVSSLIIPPVNKSEKLHSLITDAASSLSYSPILTNVSELSQLHKICSDIKCEMDKIPNLTDFTNLNVSEYKKHIPRSLLWTISLLISNESDTDNIAVISICQDIIYNYFKGKKFTPKHVGLGIFVHQETRSKKIVETLHSCGHSISYKDVLRLRNSIAQEELTRFVNEDNCYIPRQLIPDRFVQFAADNIDILEETLDKSPTFHGTQIISFQKGPPNENISTPFNLLPYRVQLQIPENFHQLHKISTVPKKVTPNITNKLAVLDKNNDENFMFSYNLSWILCRTEEEEVVIPQWTGFGKLIHKDDMYPTTYGYLPLLPYVASEYDTVFTTMRRCSQITKKLNIPYTVITFDQAIYYKAKQIQWLKPEECNKFIIRMGGFHIMLNFLRVIGQHMHNTGLGDVWLESGLYGESTVTGILSGKKWSKGIRAHKITYESLMRILVPIFEKWITDCNSELIHTLNISRLMAREICSSVRNKEQPKRFFEYVKTVEELKTIFNEFVENQPANFKMWCDYLELVEILLEFLYSERVGNWSLHLRSFRRMLPWFFAYDHTNYSRWGSVYLCDMLDLPNVAPEVHKEFLEGNYVVKKLSGGFNRLSVDQALEHVNKTSKDAGGIIGLTKNSTRLDEWYLSFNDIGNMTKIFLTSLKLSDEGCTQNIEIGKQRILVDEKTVLTLIEQFTKYDVFAYNSETENNLLSIATKEVYDKETQTIRMTAKNRGENAFRDFVNIIDTTNFYTPLKKLNKPGTSRKKSDSRYLKKTETLQGQQFLQRCLAAKEMGRNVDYNNVFQYELTTFPMSLTLNGNLSTPSNKSALGRIIENYGTSYTSLPNFGDNGKLCHIFDGMATVQGLGKPQKCNTFGEYAEIFCNIIFRNKHNAQRIDVVFDHYRENSIKNITRRKRGPQISIQRIIENNEVPLPQQWNLFIHSIFNKKQLTNFLSQQLIKHSNSKAPLQFVTSGGYNNHFEYKTNFDIVGGDLLASNHEEADTRILLHVVSAKISGFTRCVIECNDTDVLILLLYYRKHLTPEVWLKVGRGNTVRYVAVHELKLEENLIRNLPALHALTGCDTTSQFSGYGKNKCWKTYLEFFQHLDGFGTDDFSENMFKNIQMFIIKLYSKNPNITSVNTLRGLLASSSTIANLPPTEDSLRFHSLRAFYQTKVWLSSLEPCPKLPCIADYGWKIDNDGNINPILTSLPPFPLHLNILTSCGCKKDCGSKVCTCKKNKMGCIWSCKCMAQKTCKNKLTKITDLPQFDEESDLDE